MLVCEQVVEPFSARFPIYWLIIYTLHMVTCFKIHGILILENDNVCFYGKMCLNAVIMTE